MNKYTFIMLFKGDWYTLRFTANQLANSAIEHSDGVLDWCCEDDEQNFGKFFTGADGIEYEASFEIPNKLSIFDGETSVLVEKDVPCLLIAVEDENGKILYMVK